MRSIRSYASFLLASAALFLVAKGEKGIYNEEDEINIVILTSIEDYDSLVRASSSIWMLQFFHPSSPKSRAFADKYRDAAKIMNGIFRFAVIDSSTEPGQQIWKVLKLKGASDSSTEDPSLFYVTPSPFDNSESHPKQYMGDVDDVPKVGQVLFDSLSMLVSERHHAYGFDE